MNEQPSNWEPKPEDVMIEAAAARAYRDRWSGPDGISQEDQQVLDHFKKSSLNEGASEIIVFSGQRNK